MKLVIFDLDNTLYDENIYFNAVFKKFCNHYKKFYHQNFLEQHLYSNGQDIFRDFLETIDFYSPYHHNELFEIYCTLKYPLKPFLDAQEILFHLKNQDISFAILTNGPVKAQKNKISNLCFQKYDVFYAREDGIEYEKPHLKAFKKVLKNYSNITQCFFVGDTLETDIIGAKNAGLTTILINRQGNKIHDKSIDFTIKNLNEIKEWI